MRKFFLIAIALLIANYTITAQCANPPLCTDPEFVFKTTQMVNYNGCILFIEYTQVRCQIDNGNGSFSYNYFFKDIKLASSINPTTGQPCYPSDADLNAIIQSMYPNSNTIDFSNNFSLQQPCMKYIEILPNPQDLADIMNPANGCFTNVCETPPGSIGTLALLVPCSENICCDWDAATNTFIPSPSCTDNGNYNPGTSPSPWIFNCSSGPKQLRYTIIGDIMPCRPWCSINGPGSVAGQPTQMARYISNAEHSINNQFQYTVSENIIKFFDKSLLKEIYVFDLSGKVIHSFKNDIPPTIDLDKMKNQLLIISGKDIEGNSFSGKVLVK